MKCPGQDTRFWDNNAIYKEPCPNCEEPIEFWKDESFQRCKMCGVRVKNPKLDLGCAEYCEFAEQCLGFINDEDDKDVK